MADNPRLKPGDPAPAFTAITHDAQTFSLADLLGTRFVLYFYPKDDTTGCTAEACDFRDNHTDFDAKGVRVLGISPDSAHSHHRFHTKYGLNFTLLADPDHTIADAYGVWRQKTNYGKTYDGIVRSTFLIGPDGTIEALWDNVRTKGHAARVLEAVG